MSRRNSNRDQDKTVKILLVTAILELVTALVELVHKLLE